MIAECRYNRGSDLGALGNVFFVRPDHGNFDLDIGRKYRVYGFLLRLDRLLALIVGDNGSPYWYPIQLFDWHDHALPARWEWSIRDLAMTHDEADGTSTMGVVCGYPELVRNPRHCEDLMEREPVALETFFGEVAQDALDNGLEASLLSRGLDDVLQFSEAICGLGNYLDQDPFDPILIWPTSKVVQTLLERGYAIAGDVARKDGENLYVCPWRASPPEVAKRIRETWKAMDEPRNLNDIVWLELTDPGREQARTVFERRS